MSTPATPGSATWRCSRNCTAKSSLWGPRICILSGPKAFYICSQPLAPLSTPITPRNYALGQQTVGKIAKWQIWNYDRSGLWSQHFHLLMLWPVGKLLHLSDPHVSSYVKWRSLECSTHVNPRKDLSKRRQPSPVLRETCLIWAGCLESELDI